MKSKLIFTLMFLLAIVPAYGAWIAPLDCDKLFNDNELVLATEAEELADICFYGSGYSEGTVTLALEGESDYTIENVLVSNGIVSSVANGLETAFTEIPAGLYTLSVTFPCGGMFEYPDYIIVYGTENETGSGPDENPDGEDTNGEIPEFSTIAAGVILLGAGYYINKRRKKMIK